ncbi:hypothetical protein [Jannaschia sp. 2305UL9-9]|uniref:hypothetical protein n=1 Tax=Jannaschia sp. 2305UL9-9 TaxID=3121638 RepID=UPI0035294661
MKIDQAGVRLQVAARKAPDRVVPGARQGTAIAWAAGAIRGQGRAVNAAARIAAAAT